MNTMPGQDEYSISKHIFAGSLDEVYDFKAKVSSAWLSIKLNQYTETKNLNKSKNLLFLGLRF